MPTFVNAHTFCASRKHWFKRARAGFYTDAVNYAINYTTKIKAKISNRDQIKFNEPVLKPGTPEGQHTAVLRKVVPQKRINVRVNVERYYG